MKCQILFSGKNKKNIINLWSAENAQRAVKVKEIVADTQHTDTRQTQNDHTSLSLHAQVS